MIRSAAVALLLLGTFASVARVETASASETSALAAPTVRLMVLGDSLTDPYYPAVGNPADAFPADLEAALTAAGYAVNVIPLSKAGDEAYDAYLRLLAWLDAGNTPPDAVIIELGTNDAIHRKRQIWTTNDFDMILQLFRDLDVEVLLTGAYGYYPDLGTGRGYTTQAERDSFEVMYMEMAEKYHTLLYPYFLSGILNGTHTYTRDDLHPNAAGVDVIVRRILPITKTLLQNAGAMPAGD